MLSNYRLFIEGWADELVKPGVKVTPKKDPNAKKTLEDLKKQKQKSSSNWAAKFALSR